MNNKIKKTFFLLFITSPLLVFAIPAAPKSFADILKSLNCLALDVVPLIVLIAFVAFITGLVGYVGAGDNEEKRSEGRKFMIYGIVGFFVMVSVWGILGLFSSTFGLQKVLVPQFKSQSVSGTQASDFSSCSNVW